jgi:hypothetical protein
MRRASGSATTVDGLPARNHISQRSKRAFFQNRVVFRVDVERHERKLAFRLAFRALVFILVGRDDHMAAVDEPVRLVPHHQADLGADRLRKQPHQLAGFHLPVAVNGIEFEVRVLAPHYIAKVPCAIEETIAAVVLGKLDDRLTKGREVVVALSSRADELSAAIVHRASHLRPGPIEPFKRGGVLVDAFRQGARVKPRLFTGPEHGVEVVRQIAPRHHGHAGHQVRREFGAQRE